MRDIAEVAFAELSAARPVGRRRLRELGDHKDHIIDVIGVGPGRLAEYVLGEATRV